MITAAAHYTIDHISKWGEFALVVARSLFSLVSVRAWVERVIRIPSCSLAALLSLMPAIAAAQSSRGLSEPAAELITLSGWIGVLDREHPDAFGAMELRLSPWRYGIRPWVGVTLTESRTSFAGGGLVCDLLRVGPARLSVGSGPFYYQRQTGVDLGFELEFYSFIEARIPTRKGRSIGVRFSHLSNAGLGRRNPGTESLSVVFAVPLVRTAHPRSLVREGPIARVTAGNRE